MEEAADHYLADDVFDALVDRLAGQDDERADEVIWNLMDARIWPARVVPVVCGRLVVE